MKLFLPIGVMHDSVLLRDFSLQSPKGSIRAEFRDATRATVDLVALRHVVRTLGPINSPNDQILRRLTVVDRDYIHAACTARRYDGKIPVHHECDCGEKLEDSVIAADVAILPGQGEPEFRDGRACYRMEFVAPTTGKTVSIVVAVPSVADDIRVIEAQEKKTGRGDLAFAQIAGTILEWDGGPAPRVAALRDMDLDDFDALQEALNKMDPPRLDNEAIIQCPACQAEHTVPIEFDRWLLPLSRRREPQP